MRWGSEVGVAPVVRLVALYTALLGLTLLVFSSFVLTRVVVTPLDKLRLAAGHVAEGGAELVVPKGGSAELLELGASLATMCAKLRAEEHKLRDKVEELHAASEKLKQAQDTVVRSERLASVGKLAAGLAHELGNPIAAILSFQELLADSSNLDDDERDFLSRMNKETERVHRILRDLLDFARPAASVVSASEDGMASASVHGAIEHVLHLVRPQKAFADVDLRTDLGERQPAVAMAAERLEQVLLNLLLNAADVVPKPGGVIALSLIANDTHVELSIEDNGGGIDPEVADRLFEPFVTTKEIGKGTGLGLAVCRGLVEAVGGEIRVEEGDQGARFVLGLPRAGVATSAAEA